MHPATHEESETIGTFDVDWDPPALYEIETNEGFSLEDLMQALGRVTHEDVPQGPYTMPIPRDDTDFYAWTQAQAQALQAKNWPLLDVAHLAEVIETLGMHEKRTMSRQFQRLLAHLLK